MWLLDEVPQALLVLGKLSSAKVLLDLFFDIGGLFFHLFFDMFFPCVELVLTAGL